MVSKLSRREFTQAVGGTVAIQTGGTDDESSFFDRIFGDDDEGDSNAGGAIYIGEEIESESINPGENELFFATDTEQFLKPTDDGNWEPVKSLDASPWVETDDGALTPKNDQPVNADEVRTGGSVKRLLVNNEDATIVVGTDTNGWGDVQDKLPLVYQEPSVVVDVPDGDWTGEDFTVPPVIEPEDPGAPLLIEGNTSTPSNVKVGGLMISGSLGKRPILVRGLQFEEPHDLADSHSLVQVEGGGGSVVMSDCNFRNPTGNASRALTVYSGRLLLKGSIDMGTDEFNNFVTVKSQGEFADSTVDSGGDITGSVTGNLYNSQNASKFLVDAAVSAWDGQGGLNSLRTPIDVYDSQNNGADNVLYASGLFLGENNGKISGEQVEVGTSATKIAGAGARGGMMHVAGRDTGGGATIFSDVINYISGDSVSTVSSMGESSAAGRTYTMNGSDIELAMASGTYTVRVVNVSNGAGISSPFSL